MAYLKMPSAKYLRECFIYNSKTGELRWKHRPYRHLPNLRWESWNGKHAGKIAGCIWEIGLLKYCQVRLDGHLYFAHRLIWKIVTGKEPLITIDHKDGNGLNNCWVNLRAATHNEQKWNSGQRKNNTSGYKGVRQQSLSKSYMATIMKNRVRYYLGSFPTPEEASMAYQIAARKFHDEFYRER